MGKSKALEAFDKAVRASELREKHLKRKGLKILKQSVEAWNRLREENPVIPNLCGVDLSGADLRRANFYSVDLSEADLRRADFYRANLGRAHLTNAKLSKADLSRANLHRAGLSGADLSGADLSGADLSQTYFRNTILREANLRRADLSGADLRLADLTKAKVAETIFREVDLSEVRGLDTLVHRGPSSVDIDTIYRSEGNIPNSFLRGAGVPDDFIAYMKSLVGKAIEFYSCFISYNKTNEDLAKRLHADLQDAGVRCWFAPEDLKWGAKIRQGIDEAIRVYDKLLILFSENALESEWVEDEVESAMEKEAQEKKTVLFPLRLDDAVMETQKSWAAKIRRSRNIGDFTDWKNHDSYKKSFDRLLRDLRASEQGKVING